MEIRVRRIALKDDYTIGKMEILYPEGWRWVADTLEDRVRDINKDGDLLDEGEQKIYGYTAIPFGRYKVAMNVISPKFSRRSSYMWCGGYLPRLLDVPHFEGILIHAGNTAHDCAGCLLVGENKVRGRLVNSMETLRRLYDILKLASSKGEEIWITIE